MAVDEENSIYVGGLPYDASEDTLRRAFEYYGDIVAVKVINDQRVRGKCYGFVTFTHPKAAERAIVGMDGERIGARVVRVNEVRTRGSRPDFGRDHRRDPGRDDDWDRGRDRARSYSRDRDHYRDRDSDRSRERDRDRDYEHGFFDRESDYPMDQTRDHDELDQERSRGHDHEWERQRNMDLDNDRDKEKSKSYDSERDKDRERQSRKRFSHPKGHDSRDLSSSSSDDLHLDVKAQLDKAIQMHEDLQKEVTQIKEKVAAKEHHISDLQIKEKKLEDALTAAQKIYSQRQSAVTKLYKCFLQLQDYNDRVKMSEKELQSLVDAAMVEADMAEDTTTKDGSMYENGLA